MFSNDFKPKISPEYFCEKCDYKTSKKSNMDNHYQSAKHMKSMIINDFKPGLSSKYICQNCHKEYKENSGLWRHKKKCKPEDCSNSDEKNDQIMNEHSDKDQLILMLIKQNSELIKETSDFKNMMMKVLENGTHNTTTTTTNSHNKAFNLNFFLNETCKDAMNITDFVESIKLQLSDLEKVGELGYVEGISNIIVKNLKDLDVTQRPVHCTDKKRETM